MSTGARVGGVRPPGIPRESWLRRKTIKSEAARRVREVTDNRANEPTETQVKLAYLAHLKAPRTRGMDVYGPMRAALVAAQGAAPQAEVLPSNRENCPGSGGHAGCGNFCSMCSLTAPVLPSSGVDDDALVQVLETHRYKGMGWCECGENVNVRDGHRRHVARAVAEWLKDQGGESR